MDIKALIQQSVDGMEKVGVRTSTYKPVLEKGELFKRPDFDKAQFPDQLTQEQQCFSNCADLATIYNKQYWYAEGFVVSENLMLPIHHAWLVRKSDNQPVEPTLDGTGKYDRGETHYMGFCLRDSRIYDWLNSGYYGLFDASDFIESLGYPSTQWLYEDSEVDNV